MCLFGCFFELAVDGNVGVLIEARVGFEPGFGLCSAFEDPIIMLEETYTPFERCERVVMLEGVRPALGFFDEFAVGYAGCRPFLWEMIGI